LSSLNITYIDDPEQLVQLSSVMKASDLIALDTEFDRSQSFYAKLGLVQVACSAEPERQFLLDTVAMAPQLIADKGGLLEVLIDPLKVKILHACSEDVEVLMHNLEMKSTQHSIVNLFDTQIAAAYLNRGSQIGYGELVKQFAGVHLTKEETRSDWVARPLTEQQIAYAANDVKYLLVCYQPIKEALLQQGRYEWVLEDSQRYVLAQQKEEAFDRYYLKFRNGWNFDKKQVALLRDLCAWREEMAREIDTPRTRIVRDSSLFEIAEKQPSSLKGLLRLKSLQGKSRDIRHVKQYANQILARVNVLDEKTEQTPPQPIEPPLERDLKQLFKACKALISEVAEQKQIPQERLLSRNELYRLVAAYAHHLATDRPAMMPQSMQGWRKLIIIQPLCELLDRYRDELVERYTLLERKAFRWQQESEPSS